MQIVMYPVSLVPPRAWVSLPFCPQHLRMLHSISKDPLLATELSDGLIPSGVANNAEHAAETQRSDLDVAIQQAPWTVRSMATHCWCLSCRFTRPLITRRFWRRTLIDRDQVLRFWELFLRSSWVAFRFAVRLPVPLSHPSGATVSRSPL